MSKAVLLSIHPKWAEKIYTGEKEVEWRKTFPTEAEPGTPVLLYETAPVCMVTGLFYWIGKETLIIRDRAYMLAMSYGGNEKVSAYWLRVEGICKAIIDGWNNGKKLAEYERKKALEART